MSRNHRLVAVAAAVAMTASCAFVDAIAPPDRSLVRLPTVGHARGSVRADRCEVPAAGEEWTRVPPDAVGVDPAAVTAAIARLAPQFTLSLRIYRNDCLIGETANDAIAASRPAELFSMTKSVVALAVGRAVELGALTVDDPIGRHVPGLDAAHGAITVEELLTQTSGLRFAWVNDLLGSTEDSVGQAMDMPPSHASGTVFEYAQTTVTTLTRVVERAVGADFQSFVQEELFGPIGIESGSWSWWRDGAGTTHGYSWLRLLPSDMARLGALVLHDGVWDGRRLIGAAYLDDLAAGTPANPGYGYLSQNNAADWYVDTFAGVRRDHHLVPSAPADLVQFSGFLEQATFVVPSLGLVVVRFGFPPGASWKYHLFANLLGGIPGAVAVEPGPPPPPDAIGWDWRTIFAWTELFARVDHRSRVERERWLASPVPNA